jgi:hypothetical protein
MRDLEMYVYMYARTGGGASDISGRPSRTEPSRAAPSRTDRSPCIFIHLFTVATVGR